MKIRGINIILWLSFLAALVSCNETIEPFENDGYAISFKNIAVDTKQTIDEIDDMSNGFSVWGSAKNKSNDEYQNIFEGTPVTKRGTVWGYDDLKFWQPNSIYRFFAFAPISHDCSFKSVDNSYNVSYSLPTEFNVSDASFTDFVVASQTEETPDPIVNAPAPVALSFSHPFVKVRLHIFKSDDNEADVMKVTNVKITGVKNSGTYSFYNSTGVAEWTGSTSQDVSSNLDGTLGVADNENEWVKLEFYALPQYISTGQVSVTISYDYTEPGQALKKMTYVAPVPQTDIWQANKIITYKAELSQEHKIRFQTPGVDTWGEQGAGIIIIQ